MREESGTTSTGVDDVLSFELSAYPNPVSGMLNIGVRGIETVDAVLHVMDFHGKLISVMEMKQSSVSIDMSSYASGIYLIRYKDAEGRTGTLKITKQ
ncbi:MAG: T9SS type A sorting domain-containing protein [Sphingobacteriales bacterium]|nr:MAG: T9SS type A sorting domain-containing protein [Sphingobacteriales bacterium]